MKIQIKYHTVNIPYNLKQWDIVKAGNHIFLHLNNVSGPHGVVIMKFCSAPILFNKVKLTMVLQIEVTNVPVECDELLKARLLSPEIRLTKSRRWQQQLVRPFLHRKFSHCAKSPFSGHKPCSQIIISIPLNQPGMVG